MVDKGNPSTAPAVTLEHLLFLHAVTIGRFGGAGGIRDRGLLEAALGRPQSGYAGQLLFTTPFERAAALWEALAQNHGFVDGNKRVALMAAAFQLWLEGYRIDADQEELVELAVRVATHEIALPDLARWLQEHSAG